MSEDIYNAGLHSATTAGVAGVHDAATTGVLMLGFGGPTPGCCARRTDCAYSPGCEATCFVSGILGDNPKRGARVAEVAQHYHALGGFSPYNELLTRISVALETELARRGQALAVGIGFRHWRPWIVDGLRALDARGVGNVVALVMAPHQSAVSWDWYLKVVNEGIAAVGAEAAGAGRHAPAIAAVAGPWWNAPGFITALADRLRESTAGWGARRIADAELIFTAHALPIAIEEGSPYRTQFAETARMAALAFGHPVHRIAFQSQPGDSRNPGSSPTIAEVVADAAREGRKEVLISAAGFLVDHIEVLYDLDHDTRAQARALGLGYTRVPCVHDHPAFIGALADRVQAALRLA